MRIFTRLHNLVTSIQRMLRNKRGSMDNELLDVPQQALDSFARLLLPKLQQFFESPEGKREFEQWKKLQSRDNAKMAK